MVINKKTQLGLRGYDVNTIHEIESRSRSHLERYLSKGDATCYSLDIYYHTELVIIPTLSGVNEVGTREGLMSELPYHWYYNGVESEIVDNDNNDIKYFITNNSLELSKKIRLSNFDSSILKGVPINNYVYLLGKDKFVKVICNGNFIKGKYVDTYNDVFFDFGLSLNSNGYYFPFDMSEEFFSIVRLMIFIEMGDISTVILKPGQMGKSRQKTYNSSRTDIIVVDSSWNKTLIREEGFSVSGHFRIQPFGTKNKYRKLIWVNSFRKNGYKRRAKSEINHEKK